MRNLLRLVVCALLMLGAAQAQVCTPGQLYLLTGIPGVYPNPLIQSALASGNQGSPYSETFTIMVPPDTTIDLSSYIGFPFPPVSVSVNFQEVTALNGLPNGLNYVCDLGSCQWTGGSNGCIKLSGTPTQGGTFNVSMSTGYNVTVPAQIPVIGGSAITIPIPGLNWTQDITAVGVKDPKSGDFWIGHNAPNPFHGTTAISYHAPKPSPVTFVVTDLAGRQMHSEVLRAVVGDNQFTFDAAGLAPGIYLYQLSNGAHTAASKMVVE